MPSPAAAKPLTRPSLRRNLAALPRAAWVICIGIFINKLGNFLNIFLVLYLTHRGYSAFLAGAALGAVGLGSFFGNAVGGSAADRIGRRWAIVISMFATAGFTLLVPLAPDVYTIIALAVVIGFFSQLYRPAGGAILVDTVEPALRMSAFGLLRLATNLGMSIGPVIGGLLSGVSYGYLFVGNAVASVLFGVLVLVMLPETKPRDEPAANGDNGKEAHGGYRHIFTDRPMQLYLLATFIASYVYIQTTATLPLHVRDIHLSNSFYALLLAINAAIIVALELPLISFTGNRNPARVFAVGLGLLSLGVGLTGAADSRATLVLTVVMWTFGEMVYTPVSTTYPGLLAPGQLRGRYQGAEGLALTLGQTAGPALGGLFYSLSLTGHWVSCAVLPLVAAGIIALAGDPRERAGQARTGADPQVTPQLVPAKATDDPSAHPQAP